MHVVLSGVSRVILPTPLPTLPKSRPPFEEDGSPRRLPRNLEWQEGLQQFASVVAGLQTVGDVPDIVDELIDILVVDPTAATDVKFIVHRSQIPEENKSIIEEKVEDLMMEFCLQ